MCIEENETWLPLNTYKQYKDYEQEFNKCYKEKGESQVLSIQDFDKEFLEIKKQTIKKFKKSAKLEKEEESIEALNKALNSFNLKYDRLYAKWSEQ